VEDPRRIHTEAAGFRAGLTSGATFAPLFSFLDGAAPRRVGQATRVVTMQRDMAGVRLGSRVVFDPATSMHWVIVEIRDAPYDRRGGRSLVFSTDGVMRRVRDFPANWFELSDEELFRLSSRR
jgi:hypothetical protein